MVEGDRGQVAIGVAALAVMVALVIAVAEWRSDRRAQEPVDESDHSMWHHT